MEYRKISLFKNMEPSNVPDSMLHNAKDQLSTFIIEISYWYIGRNYKLEHPIT